MKPVSSSGMVMCCCFCLAERCHIAEMVMGLGTSKSFSSGNMQLTNGTAFGACVSWTLQCVPMQFDLGLRLNLTLI